VLYQNQDGSQRSLNLAEQLIATGSWFIMAMSLYPEVQRRAQAELDAVTGGERLPRLEDRPKLPYIEALVKEVYRWHAVPNNCTLPVSKSANLNERFFSAAACRASRRRIQRLPLQEGHRVLGQRRVRNHQIISNPWLNNST
jgi:hypothetical protein